MNNQKMVADATYASTIKLTPRVIKILSRAARASKREKKGLRKELRRALSKQYKILKDAGVLQYQFVLPNNESFLRMHKPNKYGDDISTVRKDFAYTNKTHKVIRGFSEGKTAHAFRNIYPIFDKRDNFIGSMEVSFSSESVQKYLTSQSKLHTHFLVDKEIFNSKKWEREDLVLKYLESGEDKEFLLTMNAGHTKDECIIQSRIKLQSVQSKVSNALEKSEKFAVYAMHHTTRVDVVSFYPVININNSKASAWIVSYGESAFIFDTLKDSYKVNAIAFGVFFILSILFYKLSVGRGKLVQQHKLINDVLNSTEDIIFATDFKTVSFANRQFKYFFNTTNLEEFNEITKNNLASIFLKTEGSLHVGMLAENQSVVEFMEDISQDNRVVSILDKSISPKVFSISVTKTNYTDNSKFLVTLSDITLMKENEAIIQKKAFTDSLTQVYNRTKFDEIFKKEFERNIRYKRDLSIAIIDIDNFKKFNDNYGHLIGDEVFIMLAKHLNYSVRSTDIFARWGGEEFVILFPETTKDEAKVICEKIRPSVETLTHPTAGSVTVSFGVTQYKENDTISSMFKRSDEALYEAKETGKNKVCVK